MKMTAFSNTILPFTQLNKRKTFIFIILFALLIQVSAISLLFFDVSMFKISIALIAIPVVLIILSSVERFFIFIVIYSTCFHLDSYHKLFRGIISVRLSWKNLYALYAAFLVYWAIHLILREKRLKISAMGWAIIIYVSIAALGFAHGFFSGYYTTINFLRRSEMFPQLMYLGFFIFLTTGLKDINRRKIFDFILFASAFVGLQLLYAFTKNSLTSFIRINTITVQISLFAFPYVLGILYFTKGMKRKAIAVFALLPISFGVLISLQRSLWLALAVVFLVSLIIYFSKRGLSFGKIFGVLIAGTLGFVIVLLIAVFGLSRITSGGAILVLLKRFISLASIQYLQVDTSGFTRMTEIKQALSNMQGAQWLYGRGLGDTFYSFIRTRTKPYVDNCYAWVLWKLGVIGLVSFLSIFAIFFHRAIFVLRKCKNETDLIFIMTIVLNMLGIMICSLGNASLVQFRYILIWSASIAILEIYYKKYRYENTPNVLE